MRAKAVPLGFAGPGLGPAPIPETSVSGRIGRGEVPGQSPRRQRPEGHGAALPTIGEEDERRRGLAPVEVAAGDAIPEGLAFRGGGVPGLPAGGGGPRAAGDPPPAPAGEDSFGFAEPSALSLLSGTEASAASLEPPLPASEDDGSPRGGGARRRRVPIKVPVLVMAGAAGVPGAVAVPSVASSAEDLPRPPKTREQRASAPRGADPGPSSRRGREAPAAPRAPRSPGPGARGEAAVVGDRALAEALRPPPRGGRQLSVPATADLLAALEPGHAAAAGREEGAGAGRGARAEEARRGGDVGAGGAAPGAGGLAGAAATLHGRGERAGAGAGGAGGPGAGPAPGTLPAFPAVGMGTGGGWYGRDADARPETRPLSPGRRSAWVHARVHPGTPPASPGAGARRPFFSHVAPVPATPLAGRPQRAPGDGDPAGRAPSPQRPPGDAAPVHVTGLSSSMGPRAPSPPRGRAPPFLAGAPWTNAGRRVAADPAGDAGAAQGPAAGGGAPRRGSPGRGAPGRPASGRISARVATPTSLADSLGLAGWDGLGEQDGLGELDGLGEPDGAAGPGRGGPGAGREPEGAVLGEEVSLAGMQQERSVARLTPEESQAGLGSPGWKGAALRSAAEDPGRHAELIRSGVEMLEQSLSSPQVSREDLDKFLTARGALPAMPGMRATKVLRGFRPGRRGRRGGRAHDAEMQLAHKHVELVSQSQPHRLPLFWVSGGPPLSRSLGHALARLGTDQSGRWQPLAEPSGRSGRSSVAASSVTASGAARAGSGAG